MTQANEQKQENVVGLYLLQTMLSNLFLYMSMVLIIYNISFLSASMLCHIFIHRLRDWEWAR